MFMTFYQIMTLTRPYRKKKANRLYSLKKEGWPTVSIEHFHQKMCPLLVVLVLQAEEEEGGQRDISQ